MNENNTSENGGESFFSKRVREKLNYWFIQYNPLYFFSALCVLFGLFLISKGLEEVDWSVGQLILSGVMQFYEILLIAGGALLFRVAGQHRPAVILGIIEIFFLFDCTFRTELMTTLGRVGIWTSVAWFVLVALKLLALLWLFRLKTSPATIIVPALAAAVIAGVPHALEFYKTDQILIHLGAIWYGFVLMASVRYLKPKIESTMDLDIWGQTVLRRVKKTALFMWAGFYLFHMLTWIEMFNVPFTLAQAAPFFLFWFLAKHEGWVWIGGLVIITLTSVIPYAVTPVAIFVAIAFGLKARETRRYRFFVGTVLFLYFACWTIGWEGKALPEANLWLNFIAAAILIVMAWRLRLPSAIFAAVLVMFPGANFLIPHGPLQWGILILVIGFIALIVGVAINWSQKKSQEQ